MSGEGFLDDYANVAHGLLELHVATGEPRWLDARRTGSRCSRSSCSTTPSTAASSSPRRAARSSSRARRGSTTTRSRPATRCSPTCCCGSAGSGVTTSSSASACRCSGSWRRRSTARAGSLRLDAVRARPLARRRRARSRSSGRSTAPSRARRSRRSRRTRSSRSGRPTACRCSRERASSTASRRCTSASGSPAGRPSTDPRRTVRSRLISSAMTTIEQTGAEEVAWDLSDLYASGDDPRIESDFAEAEAATAAFRDRYLRQGRDPVGGRARGRDRRVRADRGDRDARPLLRAHELLHEHGRPRPRRARREARREGRRASRRSSSSSASSGPRSRTRRPRRCSRTRRSTTGATGSRRSACSAPTC